MGFFSKTKKAALAPISQSMHGVGVSLKVGTLSTSKNISKSLHGKAISSAKSGKSKQKYSYSIVSQCPDEDFEENNAKTRVDRPESSRQMDLNKIPGLDIKGSGTTSAEFYPESITDRSDINFSVSGASPPESPKSVIDLDSTHVLKPIKPPRRIPPPSSDKDSSKSNSPVPALASDQVLPIESAQSSKRKKALSISASLHGKSFSVSKKKSSSSLSLSLHGSLHGARKGSLTKSLHGGLSRSLHGIVSRKTGSLESLVKELSKAKAAPLKSCLKKPKEAPTDDDDQSEPSELPGSSKISALGAKCEEQMKHVVFDVVDVREYVASISDNPMVVDGMGVSIGWEYTCKEVLPVDEYESRRPPKASSEKEFILDYVERLKILRTTDYSMKEIKKSIEASRKARNLRLQTLQEIRAEDRKCADMMKQLSRKRVVKEFEGCTED